MDVKPRPSSSAMPEQRELQHHHREGLGARLSVRTRAPWSVQLTLRPISYEDSRSEVLAITEIGTGGVADHVFLAGCSPTTPAPDDILGRDIRERQAAPRWTKNSVVPVEAKVAASCAICLICRVRTSAFPCVPAEVAAAVNGARRSTAAPLIRGDPAALASIVRADDGTSAGSVRIILHQRVRLAMSVSRERGVAPGPFLSLDVPRSTRAVAALTAH